LFYKSDSSFQLLFIGYVQDWYSIHCKTRESDGISALRARLGHFSPIIPPNTTYREMSRISGNESILNMFFTPTVRILQTNTTSHRRPPPLLSFTRFCIFDKSK
jgi:hypothetical protein